MHQAIWQALADPSRRRILDLLKDQPRTTGELAEQFDQSRFGVMKHLSVLESAGLLIVERRGRRRWNHLNAVPLREIYERWLGRYQEFWSSSLLRLKDAVADGRQQNAQSDKERTMGDFHSFIIKQEVTLDAAPDKVWSALTADIGSWWAFHVGKPESKISLDARLGGYFEERWGDGEGVIWGKVVDLRRGERLRLTGSLGMTGAGRNDYVYELEHKGEKTVVTLTHHAFGYQDVETKDNYTEGWKMLLETHLTAWLHEGKAAERLDAKKD